jgi:hypothetical protein
LLVGLFLQGFRIWSTYKHTIRPEIILACYIMQPYLQCYKFQTACLPCWNIICEFHSGLCVCVCVCKFATFNLTYIDPCIIAQFLQKTPTRCNSVDATLYQNFIILYLNEAQHLSGYTPRIIRRLKLHKQPLVLHNIVEGCPTCSCWTL